MTPAKFFDNARRGDKVRLNNGQDLYEVLHVVKGSYARLVKVGETVSAFVCLQGAFLRFENLNGPHYETVELVSEH